MEKEFYTDSFEDFLKESTEDFKMYPSRRVWHSIYNNIHPAKKWPSLAVSLLLLSAILYIGITNNNAINASASKTLIADHQQESLASNDSRRTGAPTRIASSLKDAAESQPTGSPNNTDNQNQIFIDNSLTNISRVQELLDINIPPSPNDETITPDNSNLENSRPGSNVTVISNVNNSNTKTTTVSPANSPSGFVSTDIVNSAQASPSTGTASTLYKVEKDPSTVESAGLNLMNSPKSSITELSAQPALVKIIDAPALTSSNTDLPWVDDHAFYNAKSKGAWKAKSSLQYYITPSIGFRKMTTEEMAAVPASSFVANAPVPEIQVDHNSAINLETGAALRYKVAKKITFKGGFQINYTSYSINAYGLKHPAQTTLALHNPNSTGSSLQPYNTYFANSPEQGNSKLNNKTLQFSIPVGIDYTLFSGDHIKWYAGASIQPSLVTGGNAYLLSADRKFYVNENSFTNRWNLNTSFETFLTYKMKNGIELQAGPQVRYQLFSTYSKQFTASEKLYNAGLKLGLIRNL